MRKIVIFEQWDNNRYYCYIGHAGKADREMDGQNYISKGGSEGMNLDVYENIFEALPHCNCDLTKVEFGRLSKFEKRIIEFYKEIENNAPRL